MDNRKENTLVADTRQRLDVSLACIPDMGSRSQAQKAIRAGNVTVDGEVRTRPSYPVVPGAVIRWKASVVQAPKLLPQALPIDVVYEDESVLVINKSARMPVHPGAGRHSGTLVNAVLHHVTCGTSTRTGRSISSRYCSSTGYGHDGFIGCCQKR